MFWYNDVKKMQKNHNKCFGIMMQRNSFRKFGIIKLLQNWSKK